MERAEQTVLLISDDAGFCARTRKELQSREASLRVAMVNSVDAARRAVEFEAPSVIVLEEAAIQAPSCAERHPRLESVVSSLAGYAPVVVMGNESRPKELDALVASGAADFVKASESNLLAAAEFVERRLKQTRVVKEQVRLAKAESGHANFGDNAEDFGQLLRHELNNPLTGILGNAELLLSEVRRKNDGQLPQGGQMRIETIAALAVRLRETVRRLSQEWESKHEQAPHSR